MHLPFGGEFLLRIVWKEHISPSAITCFNLRPELVFPHWYFANFSALDHAPGIKTLFITIRYPWKVAVYSSLDSRPLGEESQYSIDKCAGAERPRGPEPFPPGQLRSGDLDEVAGVCGGRGPVISLLMGMEWPFRRVSASETAEAGSMRNSWAAQRAYDHPKADCCISENRCGKSTQ